MASNYAIERARGQKESRRQLMALKEKWPAAFPLENHDVRPLSIGAAGEISTVMGWQLPYTLGVLSKWKMAPAYCQAVLRCDQRIGLDGSPAETVDANSRDLAAKRLEELAGRKSAKAVAMTEAVAGDKPKAAARTAPAETSEQLRARVRASLLRRRA